MPLPAEPLHLLQRRVLRERRARLRAERGLVQKQKELLDSIEAQRQALEFMQWRLESLDQEAAHKVQALAFDQDRQELLEMIARNNPLGHILQRLQHMVEGHIPGSTCVVIQAPQNPAEPHLSLDETPEPMVNAAWGLQKLPDLQEDPHPQVLQKWARDLQVRHGWSIPILFGPSPFLGLLILGFHQETELLKQDVELLEHFARMAGMAINHRHLLDSLAHQARFDNLTNLPNRALFQDRLQQAVSLARRTGELVGLLFLDLDGFKHINDTLGHHVGDQLLIGVAQRLQSMLRTSDTLARMGGDEFTVVLVALKDAQGASRVAQKCLQALSAPFLLQGHELFIGTSIGISLFPQDAEEPDQLQRNADAAMYQTKAKGKNGFTFFTPDMNANAQERLEMEGLLRKALDQGEFRLHFQPQFRLDGSLSGCEALLRWNQPRMGMVPPGKFIPIAEETGLILPLGNWVLQEACRCMAGWIQRGYKDLTIAVNVSSMQFEQDDFVLRVEEALATENLGAHQLELELTESLVMENPRENARRLEALRELGVRIAVDDFGTGYSSLSYLQRLPLDTLKIDQSFVRDIYPDANHSTSSAPIVETIIGLARNLHLSLMAEGVETEAQREFLKALDCDGMQGYLLGRPMDAAAFGTFLESAAILR